MLAQSPECGNIVTPADFQTALNQKAAILQAKANASPSTVATVPVRFNIVLNDAGTAPVSSLQIDETYIETVLQNLEQKYSSTDYTYNFVLCGDINYIHNSSFLNGTKHVEDYSYVRGAANVYVVASGNVGNNTIADFPWQTPNERLWIQNYNLLDPGFAHEFGHHFGLFHTFNPSANYQIPLFPNDPNSQSDHPYNNGQNGGFPRELVIRDHLPPTSSYIYKTVNCGESGDLICETPAGCEINGTTHPGCSFIGYPTCSYNGTYVDYNQMSLQDPDDIIAKNIMSYETGICRQELVGEQKDRAFGYYEDVRKLQYKPWNCGNLSDKVEFKGTNVGQNRVAVAYDFFGIPIKALTNPEGEFNGILEYNTTNQVTAVVQKLGLNPDFSFKPEEWTDGVTTFDLVLITKHVLGIAPLDGYNLVAADVNNSGSVTTFDGVLIRKLILGIDNSFVAFDQPWRFIPEYIPMTNPQHFDGGWDDINVFQYELTGSQPYGINGTNGKAGFDAVKLGDVNGSNSEAGLTGNPPEGDPVYVTIVKTVDGASVNYDFQVEDFEDIIAYQLDIQFTEQYLDYSQSLERDLEGVIPDFFGTSNANEGVIKTLWYDEYSLAPVTLDDLDEIFRIVFDEVSNNPNAEVNILQSVGFRSNDSPQQLRNFAIGADGRIRPIVEKKYSGNKVVNLSAVPNPFFNSVNVFIEAMEAGEVEVALFNSVGQQMYQSKEMLKKGSNQLQISGLEHLSGGLYMVAIQSDGQSFSEKILKIK